MLLDKYQKLKEIADKQPPDSAVAIPAKYLSELCGLFIWAVHTISIYESILGTRQLKIPPEMEESLKPISEILKKLEDKNCL